MPKASPKIWRALRFLSINSATSLFDVGLRLGSLRLGEMFDVRSGFAMLCRDACWPPARRASSSERRSSFNMEEKRPSISFLFDWGPFDSTSFVRCQGYFALWVFTLFENIVGFHKLNPTYMADIVKLFEYLRTSPFPSRTSPLTCLFWYLEWLGHQLCCEASPVEEQEVLWSSPLWQRTRVPSQGHSRWKGNGCQENLVWVSWQSAGLGYGHQRYQG